MAKKTLSAKPQGDEIKNKIERNMKLLRKIRAAVKELSPDKSSGEWRLHGMRGLDSEAVAAHRKAQEEWKNKVSEVEAKRSEIRRAMVTKYDIVAKEKAANDADQVLREARRMFEAEYRDLVEQAEKSADLDILRSALEEATKKGRKEADKLYKELIRLELLAEAGKTPDKVTEEILALAKKLGLVEQAD